MAISRFSSRRTTKGVHYWRDHTGKWSKGGAFGNGVTEILGFVQSSFGHIGNFEAVVLENGSKTHYWRDNDAPGFPWHKTVTF